jgi:hypothetical protein
MKELNEEELLDLKQRIDEAKTAVSELNGQKTSLMKQLKEEWDCKSTEEGDKKIQQLLKEIKDLDTKIATGTKELEEKYELGS